VPDELREAAYQAVVLVRFTIHRDGSTSIELLQPSNSPGVNGLLLSALKQWRFAPALKDGQAVESHQDLRVRLNVD
jgi:protein TonB